MDSPPTWQFSLTKTNRVQRVIYLCKVNEVLALTRDHERRAVAAIASRFNRVEPSHGQEAFASASTASPQLAYRLAAPPGHESGLRPTRMDTNNVIRPLLDFSLYIKWTVA